MTTTSERKGLDGRSAAAELRPAAVVAPRGRRRPALLVAGLAMVALGALAAIWLVSASGQRVPVALLAHDVPYGTVLTQADLTTTAVSVDPSVSTVPAADAVSLVGQTATTNLTRGQLLTRSEVTAAGVLTTGEVLVPLPVPAGRMPAPADRGDLAAELLRFPYVNGGIFEERITLPSLDGDFRKAILDANPLRAKVGPWTWTRSSALTRTTPATGWPTTSSRQTSALWQTSSRGERTWD